MQSFRVDNTRLAGVGKLSTQSRTGARRVVMRARRKSCSWVVADALQIGLDDSRAGPLLQLTRASGLSRVREGIEPFRRRPTPNSHPNAPMTYAGHLEGDCV